MSFVYSLYGLHIDCNQKIPGLVDLPGRPSADVRVWLNVMPPWLERIESASEQTSSVSLDKEKTDRPIVRVWLLDDTTYFGILYCDGTEFIFDKAGQEVWGSWPDSSSLEDTATYLLGPILGSILRLRNVVCLHASAVAVDDKCLAIVGASGAGKSTTAAAFAQAGLPILSDDVVALWEEEKGFLVPPAYPRLRLWSTSVETLYGKPDALPCLTPNWDKRYLDLTQEGYKFQQEPLSLAAIYILGDRITSPTAPFLEKLPSHTGLISLISNTYAHNFLDKKRRAAEFDLLSRLVAKVPLRRVTPHADSERIYQLCNVILKDFQQLDNG